MIHQRPAIGGPEIFMMESPTHIRKESLQIVCKELRALYQFSHLYVL